MDKHSITLLSCIGGIFLGMSIQLKNLVVIALSFERDNLSQPSLPTLSDKEVCDRAESITVTIMLLDNSPKGSGFLVSQAGTVYTIVTNKHVLTDAKQYKIQTRDGNYYIATRVPFDSSDDLALLSFQVQAPSRKYEIARLESGLKLDSEKGDRVIAAGFPRKSLASQSVEFVCTPPGNIYRVLKKPMESGYQIGYFINVQKGMSGGPLLNSKGMVVGVNGKSKPLWGARSPQEMSNLFVYQNDCSLVLESLSLEDQKLMVKSSWAIPIDTVDTQVRQARLPGINLTVLQPPPSSPISTPSEVVNKTNQESTTPQTPPSSPTSTSKNAGSNANQESTTPQPPPSSSTNTPKNTGSNANQQSTNPQPPPSSSTNTPKNTVSNANQQSTNSQPPPSSSTNTPKNTGSNANQQSTNPQPPPSSSTNTPKNTGSNANQQSTTPQPPPSSLTNTPKNAVSNANQQSTTPQPPPSSPTIKPEGTKSSCPSPVTSRYERD